MPVLSIDNVMATEDTTAIFRVTLSAVSDDVVSVDYNTQAVTATAGSDYTEVIDKTLTIAPGQISGTIAVDVIINEPSDEGPETATVTLSNSVGAVIDASAYVGTLTILEGPELLPMLSIKDVSVLETDENVDVEITVSLSTADPTNEVTVEYETFDGDRGVTGEATAGSDYLSTSGTLTFEAGDTTETFTVTVRPDTLVEGDETVLLILRNAIYASIEGQGSAILTITDLTIVIPNPTGDDDNDGITNIQEVTDGSDPLNPDDPVEGGGNDDDGDG